MSPVWLPHELRSYVITEAISTSFSVGAHEGIAFLPFSTRLTCSAIAPLAILLPSSAGNAPAPLPVGWWQTAQFAAYTLPPRSISSAIV